MSPMRCKVSCPVLVIGHPSPRRVRVYFLLLSFFPLMVVLETGAMMAEQLQDLMLVERLQTSQAPSCGK